jgi:hypothetical protein
MSPRIVALAAVLVAVTALPSDAAPTTKPQIVDAPNDAVGGQPQTEIVSALWTTSGTTYTEKVRGKKRTVYLPKMLVATVTLAGAPATTAPFTYETSAQVAGCGEVRFVYTPGTVYSGIISDRFLWYDCGPGDSISGPGLTLVPNVRMKVGAKSITWEYPIRALGTSVKVGAAVTEFRAAADVVDPVLGLYSPGFLLGTPIDLATSDAVWKLGS